MEYLTSIGFPCSKKWSAFMNFALTEEQAIFQASVLKFSKKYLEKDAQQRAHAAGYPFDVAKLMAKEGLLGLTIPEEQGGLGGTVMDAIIAIETVASVCPKSADVVQAGNFGAIRVLAEYCTPEQKERVLTKLLAGEKVISVGMTEPDAGSAVTELKTTATPDGNGFRINGSKVFTTHGPFADIILAYVRFGPGVDGIGSVLIERGMPGFTVGNKMKFMSGEEWATLTFDNVFVPAENILLRNGGFKKQIDGFNVERLGNSARSLALGRYAYEEARNWAMTRRQFGRLLCEFQGVQWKFADMRMRLDAAALLLYRAASNAKDGFPRADETAIAKAYCNIVGHEVAGEAMQVMGGMGFSSESLVEYCYRRTKGWMIAGGSVEILKNRISEAVFDRRFSQRAHAR